ncbi:hypothetical protein Rsub_09547 [Raphidocelis subcapitata]|uniref:Flagellar associated protein n=1 Tax=Raphidocelis subcapitata TaxID=307507 RepID=A0A2V0PB35_9CHLO|nr:hypothetical protein Rsub_09547 [Raphidocelis subcapitata]|eukprot:GBF97074.1 hypothetical protein Rsub_09547 [Raphidocelis subcapitata]
MAEVDTCMALLGIPGYKGFQPGFARTPVPIKIGRHLGRQPDAETRLAAEAAPPRDSLSEHRAAYTLSASASRAAHPGGLASAGGGYWFEERSRVAAGRRQPFLGTTTYRAELLQGPATAARQLAASQHVPATLVGYSVARAAAACGGTLRAALSGTAGVASTGALDGSGTTAAGRPLVGYRTTYGSANVPIAESAAARLASASASASAEAAAPRRAATAPDGGAAAAAPPPRRAASAPRPRFEGASSYARDFVGDPMAHLPPGGGARDAVTLGATTGELGAGTTRACFHVPGYTGFVPASLANATARAQGAGAAPRADARPSLLLLALDQFDRGRLPGYTGYKPRGGPGATAEQPAGGPTSETTQGFLNSQLLRRGPQPHSPAHCINSRAGLMSFFSSGTNGARGEPSISDNGLSDAQRFFVRLRPLEGRMKGGAAASRTTASGARFDSVLAKAGARR